jgi:hypothetical protein
MQEPTYTTPSPALRPMQPSTLDYTVKMVAMVQDAREQRMSAGDLLEALGIEVGAGTITAQPPKKPPAVAQVSTEQRLLHTRREAAAMLSISVRSLDYHIEHARIRVKRHGASILIAHSELIRFAKENHPDPVSAPSRAAS